MPSYNSLPGVQIQTVDGGLFTRRTPSTKSLLILGTATRGPADTPYEVTDRDIAVSLFGTDGTLIRAMEEAAVYCDNIFLMRIGTKAGQLAGVGADTDSVDGMTLVFGERAEDADTRYKVWYRDGILYVWLDGTLVYSNDASAGNVLDVGNVDVSGLATEGLILAATEPGTGTIATVGTALTGTGSSFTDELAVGDLIVAPSGIARAIKTITDGTHAVLESAFPIDVVAGAVFTIVKAATDKTPDGALTVAQAKALTTIGSKTKPVFTAADTGTSMTLRQLYVAHQKALDLLDTYPVQGVFAPGCVLDAPNVAFYNSLDVKTEVHNPANNVDALDWLKTTTDDFGSKTYHWASETKDSSGAVVSAKVFATRYDRLKAGYHEVNFGYQLARFAQTQEEELGGCLAFIGTTGPNGYDLPNIRQWIGFLPKTDPVSGDVIKAGSGLLGIPCLVGCPAGSLNPLTHDYTNGSRVAGFYETDTAEYDGSAKIDRNQYPIDLGAYLHVVGEWAQIVTGNGRYVTNICGLVAGFVQALDAKSSPTNKPLRLVRQLYRSGLGQLDALTQANINMLKFKRVGEPPYLLHGMTAAGDISDWTNVLRMRIKFLVVQQIFEEGDRFVGESTADGMQLQAMQTALEARLMNLQKRGYIQRYRFQIHTTEADQRIGRAFIDVNFMPADELIQLRATVSISRQ